MCPQEHYKNIPQDVPQFEKKIGTETSALERTTHIRVMQNVLQRAQLCGMADGGHLQDFIHHNNGQKDSKISKSHCLHIFSLLQRCVIVIELLKCVATFGPSYINQSYISGRLNELYCEVIFTECSWQSGWIFQT